MELCEYQKLIDSFIRKQTYIYLIKNNDYGDSVKSSLDSHGSIAYIVRAEDKIRRFERLLENEAQVSDETIKDTLLDLFNYTVMHRMWKDNDNRLTYFINVANKYAKENFKNYIQDLKETIKYLKESTKHKIQQYMIEYLWS